MTTTHHPQFFTISDIINGQREKLKFSYDYSEAEAKAIFTNHFKQTSNERK